MIEEAVRAYFAALDEWNSWAEWRRLQVRGAARQGAKRKAKRQLVAAEEKLRALVGCEWKP